MPILQETVEEVKQKIQEEYVQIAPKMNDESWSSIFRFGNHTQLMKDKYFNMFIIKNRKEILVKELYDDYCTYCTENKLKQETSNKFTKDISIQFNLTKKRIKKDGKLDYYFIS